MPPSGRGFLRAGTLVMRHLRVIRLLAALAIRGYRAARTVLPAVAFRPGEPASPVSRSLMPGDD
jgi:hypothetical protein